MDGDPWNAEENLGMIFSKYICTTHNNKTIEHANYRTCMKLSLSELDGSHHRSETTSLYAVYAMQEDTEIL